VKRALEWLLNEAGPVNMPTDPQKAIEAIQKAFEEQKVRTEKLWQKIEDLDAAIQAAQRTQAAAKAHQEERDSK